MSSELVHAGVIIVAKILKEELQKRERKKTKRTWLRPWIARIVVYVKLLQELKDEDPTAYQNILRLDANQFDNLLLMIQTLIEKKDTRMKMAVPASTKLEITLRYLATGDLLKTLEYLFSVPELTSSSSSYYNCLEALYSAGLAVLCVGCSVGWTTPTLKNLKKPGSPIPITPSQSSWLAASHEVGHFLSPIPSGLLIGRLGRKYCLLASSFILIVGWLVIYFANNVVELYIARFFFGISMGIVFTTVPLYIAEIASPRIRGALSTCFQAMLYLGHLIEFSIGPYVPFSTLNLISLIIACACFFMLFFIVESPLHLMAINKKDKALSTIRWLYKVDQEKAEEEASELEIMNQTRNSNSAAYLELFSKEYSWRLVIVVFTAVAQRFTGMSAVVAYAATNFKSVGSLTSDELTIIFGALVFVFTFVSASLIDNMGRRPLILISCLGCAVTHFVTGTYFYKHFENMEILPFIMISLFSVIYSLGLGPLVNTLQGELFPPQIKGLASSIVTVAHAASSFIVTKLFGVISEKEGLYLNFYIFGASCTASFVLSYFVVPETKREQLSYLQGPRDELS